jgi:predicted membrane channel-forming protein YqfA (hemolysin III family)
VNGVSHGVGLLCAIAATPLLLAGAAARGGAGGIVGGSVFGASLVLQKPAQLTDVADAIRALLERTQ